MKTKIFFIIVIGVVGFFSLNLKDHAEALGNLPIQKDPSEVPIKTLNSDQVKNPKNNCNKLPDDITTDGAARGKCFFYNRHFEIGIVDGKYYCCEPEGPLEVQTPLGPLAPTGQTAEERLKASQEAYRCGELLKFEGAPGETTIRDYKVSEGLNTTWPKSPMGTTLTENLTISGLIKYIYDWLIGLSGLFVFISLIWAGFQYLTSAGNPGKMGEAVKRIRTASIGLVLLLGSWLILNTINPRLLVSEFDLDKPMRGTAVDFGSTEVGSICGITCEKVIFYAGENFTNEIASVPVGKENIITKNMSEVSGDKTKQIKSVDFQPHDESVDPPKVGDCSVTLYPHENKVALEGEEALPLLSPVKNIGGEKGFPAQSFEAGDASGVAGFNLGF